MNNYDHDPHIPQNYVIKSKYRIIVNCGYKLLLL